jgi:hypothetical protein
VSDKRRGPLVDLAKSGQDLYRELAGELPMDIHLERKGSILIGESERDRWALVSYVRKLRDCGVRAGRTAWFPGSGYAPR